ncbi:MAG: helix-hairpin-helix domain-containing protein [Candidatus Aquicultorales bacterium]
MGEELRSFIRDKAAEWGLNLTGRQFVVVLTLAGLLLAGVATLQLRNRPAEVAVVDASPKKAEDRNSSSGKATVATIIVHVSGAVAKPGVYEIAKGSRVYDALDVAGAALPEGDLESLNLAAKLADGARIHLPKKGEKPAAPSAASGSYAGDQPAGRVNLNTATAEQLVALPGVGEVLAKRILSYREEHGGFQSVEELRQVDGIGAKKFDDLKDEVVVE